jgi:hypothetical protein
MFHLMLSFYIFLHIFLLYINLIKLMLNSYYLYIKYNTFKIYVKSENNLFYIYYLLLFILANIIIIIVFFIYI